MKLRLALAAGVAMIVVAAPAWAQDAPPPQETPAPDPDEKPAAKPPSDSDTLETIALPAKDEVIDVAAIKLPAMAFKPDPAFEKDFDKYYYFHRDNTDFKTALGDLRDCDNLSRGLASPIGDVNVPYPYAGTAGGVIGGAIAGAMVAAIFGSAQVRATRRVNMRRCMFFKGYERFGLPKDIWKEFNFEEGFGAIAEAKRQVFLQQQAKVASGDRPTTPVLGR